MGRGMGRGMGRRLGYGKGYGEARVWVWGWCFFGIRIEGEKDRNRKSMK